MKDFTKEELRSLKWAIDYVRERTNNRGDAIRSLDRKVQSLITNFNVDICSCSACEYSRQMEIL